MKRNLKTALAGSTLLAAIVAMAVDARAQSFALDWSNSIQTSGGSTGAHNSASYDELTDTYVVSGYGNPATLYLIDAQTGDLRDPAFTNYAFDPLSAPQALAGFGIVIDQGQVFINDHDETNSPVRFGGLQLLDSVTDTEASLVLDTPNTDDFVGFIRNMSISGTGVNSWLAATGDRNPGPSTLLRAKNESRTEWEVMGFVGLAYFVDDNENGLVEAEDVDGFPSTGAIPRNYVRGFGRAGIAISEPGDLGWPRYMAAADVIGQVQGLRLMEYKGAETATNLGNLGYKLIGQRVNDLRTPESESQPSVDVVIIEGDGTTTGTVLVSLQRPTDPTTEAAHLVMYQLDDTQAHIDDTLVEVHRFIIPLSSVDPTSDLDFPLDVRGSLSVDTENQVIYGYYRNPGAAEGHTANVFKATYTLPPPIVDQNVDYSSPDSIALAVTPSEIAAFTGQELGTVSIGAIGVDSLGRLYFYTGDSQGFQGGATTGQLVRVDVSDATTFETVATHAQLLAAANAGDASPAQMLSIRGIEIFDDGRILLAQTAGTDDILLFDPADDLNDVANFTNLRQANGVSSILLTSDESQVIVTQLPNLGASSTDILTVDVETAAEDVLSFGIFIAFEGLIGSDAGIVAGVEVRPDHYIFWDEASEGGSDQMFYVTEGAAINPEGNIAPILIDTAFDAGYRGGVSAMSLGADGTLLAWNQSPGPRPIEIPPTADSKALFIFPNPAPFSHDRIRLTEQSILAQTDLVDTIDVPAGGLATYSSVRGETMAFLVDSTSNSILSITYKAPSSVIPPDMFDIDSDNDGYSDGYELFRQSDPNNPNSVPNPLLGDINGDGIVDMDDVQALAEAIANGTPLTVERAGIVDDNVLSDPSDDDVFNAEDVTQLGNFVSGRVDILR